MKKTTTIEAVIHLGKLAGLPIIERQFIEVDEGSFNVTMENIPYRRDWWCPEVWYIDQVDESIIYGIIRLGRYFLNRNEFTGLRDD